MRKSEASFLSNITHASTRMMYSQMSKAMKLVCLLQMSDTKVELGFFARTFGLPHSST